MKARGELTMPHDYHELENVLRHERCLAMEDAIDLMPGNARKSSGPVRDWTMEELTEFVLLSHSQKVNAQESLEVLGKLLANCEARLRSFTDGTKEEQMTCAKRYSEVTREPSVKAADVLAEFKRQVFAESEKYKEKLNASDD